MKILGRSPASGSDELALLDWWSWAYAETLARQHDAQWLDFTPNERVDALMFEAERRSTLRLEGSLLEHLGDMSSYSYATVLQQAEPARREFSHGKVGRATRTLSMIVHEHPSSGHGWYMTCLRTGSWALVLLALAALSLAYTLYPSSRWLLVVPVLTILLTGVPWAQLLTLFSRRPHALDGVLHLKD